jgi:hypothetical protein
VIDDDVLAFIRSRPIAMLGTRDHDNRPYAHETFLAEIEPDHLVALVLEQFARNLAANVADNGAAAVLVSRQPGDHRSVQLKGKITSLESVRKGPEIYASFEKMKPIFRAFMPEAAAEAFLARVAEQPALRLRFEPARAFDQTPGRGAGRQIGARA